jgi:hypothetical protein
MFFSELTSNHWKREGLPDTTMPPIILIPLAYAGLRTAIATAVEHKVRQGIGETAVQAVHQVSHTLIVQLAEISINILLFLLIIYKAAALFDYHTTVLMICSVYVGSLIHSTYKIIKNFNLILNIIRDYRLNIKQYLFEQIYENTRLEARREFESMGLLKRVFYRASAGPGENTIALRIANGTLPLIWHRVLTRLVMILVTVGLYILIFRMIVSPFLIQQTTHFSLLQAFLWPFAYSIDFFFHTAFSSLVLSLG